MLDKMSLLSYKILLGYIEGDYDVSKSCFAAY